jgi:DNA-directed RNA polymerase alpha subunit
MVEQRNGYIYRRGRSTLISAFGQNPVRVGGIIYLTDEEVTDLSQRGVILDPLPARSSTVESEPPGDDAMPPDYPDAADSLDAIGLDAGTVRVLNAAGYHTVDDLAGVTDELLLTIHGIGRERAATIGDALAGRLDREGADGED